MEPHQNSCPSMSCSPATALRSRPGKHIIQDFDASLAADLAEFIDQSHDHSQFGPPPQPVIPSAIVLGKCHMFSNPNPADLRRIRRLWQFKKCSDRKSFDRLRDSCFCVKAQSQRLQQYHECHEIIGRGFLGRRIRH